MMKNVFLWIASAAMLIVGLAKDFLALVLLSIIAFIFVFMRAIRDSKGVPSDGSIGGDGIATNAHKIDYESDNTSDFGSDGGGDGGGD